LHDPSSGRLPVREDLERLLELQKIDVVLAESAWEAEALPKKIAELEGHLTSADALVAESEESLQQITKDRLRLEGDLRDQSARLEDLKRKQLAIKTNEEYAALSQEIDYMRNTISQTEDVVLKLLEDVDTKHRELDERRTEAARVRAELEGQVTELKAELERLREYVMLKNDERTRVAMHVDERILLRYERILASKGDSALVPLVDDVCTGCYKHLPPQAAIEVKRGDRFVECDSCGRILYWRGAADDE
jgi:predicted  nucleic acid-binding Zn-ribbon protein